MSEIHLDSVSTTQKDKKVLIFLNHVEYVFHFYLDPADKNHSCSMQAYNVISFHFDIRVPTDTTRALNYFRGH